MTTLALRGDYWWPLFLWKHTHIIDGWGLRESGVKEWEARTFRGWKFFFFSARNPARHVLEVVQLELKDDL